MTRGEDIFAPAPRSSPAPTPPIPEALRAATGSADRSLSTNAAIALRCLLVAGLVISCALIGALRPLDDALANLRFSALQRAPTGDIGFLEIDAASLKKDG